MAIHFGPAGNSESFYAQGNKSSKQAPRWIHDMGLNAYEYSFGHGVRMGEELAAQIKSEAQKYGITLSIHCPYYINLATTQEEQRERNWNYIKDAVTLGEKMGATRAVLHPGSAKGERGEAFERNRLAFAQSIQRLREEGLGGVLVVLETMGKLNQLGDLEEVLTMCEVSEYTIPCLDFGHLNARTQGGLKTRQDFKAVLDALENRLGQDRARVFHAHFSQISFGKSGEIKHMTFADGADYGPDFELLAQEIAQRGWSPTIICESRGTMAEDALQMKRMYERAVFQSRSAQSTPGPSVALPGLPL